MGTEAEPPHYLETLHDELALALGKAIWAFARIEHLTYVLMRRHSRERLDELVDDLGICDRTKILRRLTSRESSDDAKLKRVKSALNTINKLAEERNTIVHNPWRIGIDFDENKFTTHIEKYSKPEKKVDLERLRTFTAECEAAEEELREALRVLQPFIGTGA